MSKSWSDGNGHSAHQKRSRHRRGGKAQTQTWGRKVSWGSDSSGSWSRQSSDDGFQWARQFSSGSEDHSCQHGRHGQSRTKRVAGSPGQACPAQEQGKTELADLTPHLIKCGVYEEYKRWREGYRRWREGDAHGAHGEGGSAMDHATTEGPLRLSQSWRDAYRNWRAGGARGARGEMEAHGQHRHHDCGPAVPGHDSILPAVIYDVVAAEGGQPALVPSDGPEIAPMLIKDFPPEAVLTIRVFRFFEDRSDEARVWEKNLLNVNSGSLFWLPWHLAPSMHTKAGAKYGTWFTIHYVQVYAKHFTSAYHMCNEGCHGGAKTFGCSQGSSRTITGESMPEGYFWYVSPAAGKEHLRTEGWQHLDRAGPFDGTALLAVWRQQGSPMEVRALQEVLAKVVHDATEVKLQ